jgi:redox-sensitive bicupin YhaK (pirin superfamily)
MKSIRAIRRLHESTPTLEGAGVRLRRAFGFGGGNELDPFLLLDDFRGDRAEDYRAGFPWHPHRGMETITYVLEGEVEHGDSLGNQGTIGPGDVQWMTAGSGIIHQEMPKGEASGRMGGLQLWANLPRSHKMMDPRYQEVTSSAIPEAGLPGGARARVIAGTIAQTDGPVRDVIIEPLYLDVTMPAATELVLPTPVGHTAFAYVIGGRAAFDPEGQQQVPNRTLVVFEDGEGVRVITGEEQARFLFVAGRPLREPVAWRGPIVMNSDEELDRAFREVRDGTFIKHGKVR